MSFTSLPQPLTASQATVRANYWANKRTDEPNGFVIYFCEDEDAHYVVGYSDIDTIEGINPDLELVDIVETPEPYGSSVDSNGTRIVWSHE